MRGINFRSTPGQLSDSENHPGADFSEIGSRGGNSTVTAQLIPGDFGDNVGPNVAFIQVAIAPETGNVYFSTLKVLDLRNPADVFTYSNHCVYRVRCPASNPGAVIVRVAG